MIILLKAIGGYFIDGYWWLLMVIDGYFINGYYWLLYYKLLLVILLMATSDYSINGY